MPDAKAFLQKVHITNFLSFTDVEFPLKPLTILVGPNASGKSNVLEVLHLLNRTIIDGKLPAFGLVQDPSPANEADRIRFRLQTAVEDARTVYNLALKAEVDNRYPDKESSIDDREIIPIRIVDEKLLVNDVEVISIRDGQCMLQDEDGENETIFNSDALALRSAGDYGNKPITRTLGEFVKRWEFHDFRSKFKPSSFPRSASPILHDYPEDNRIWSLSSLLLHWYDKDRERFNSVSECLEASTNFKMEIHSIAGVKQLTLVGHKSGSPLETASDGTIRLIAYYTLLNQPKLPPLIAIEEPERNLHPGALTEIANVLEQLAEQSQVIITTHSSQLLDVLKPENLSDSLGVLLLRNSPARGTEIFNLEDISGDRAALDGWISDFGIGSAIFESELLQDLME